MQETGRRTANDAAGGQKPWQSVYRTLATRFIRQALRLTNCLEDLWDRSFKNLPAHERDRLKDFDRKFDTVPYAPKDYHDYDDQLEVILRALISQNVVRVDYAGLSGEGKQRDFDPYTLVAYRGGLYVLGVSRLYRRIIYLAVERMRSVEFVLDRAQDRVRFAYPKGYRPEKHLDGAFGLLDGPETQVELLLLADTEAYLRHRIIHRKNDPIYSAHSYHTKVPPRSIIPYILHYTKPGDLVLDSFCGSGMTGVAAQMCADPPPDLLEKYPELKDRVGPRACVLSDLSPAACHIAYNYNTPVDIDTALRE